MANMDADSDLRAILACLGLLETGLQDARIIETEDWRQLGHETFILEFQVVENRPNRLRSRDYLVKACVVGTSGSLHKTLLEWVERRHHLQRLGISVPNLVGTGRALLIEEKIPNKLYSYIHSVPNEQTRKRLIQSMLETAATLHLAGYNPISLHDWMSRGNDVVLVDFGSDLGPPGATPPDPFAIFRLIMGHLRLAGSIEEDSLQSMRDEYARLLRSFEVDQYGMA